MSQIPGAVRKLRAVVDWTVGLPFARDVAEVGSIGHPRPLRAEVYERGGTHRPGRHRPVAPQCAVWHTSSSPSPSASRPAIVGRAKGSSFFIWFLVGAVLPLLGLIAVVLYRFEKVEPERTLPALRQDPQALRPGLHALRRGPLPARPERGPPSA